MDIDIAGNGKRTEDIPPVVELQPTPESEDDDDGAASEVDKRDHDSTEDDANDDDDDDTVGEVDKRDHESTEDNAYDDGGYGGGKSPERPPLIKRSAKFRAAW